MTLRKSIRRKLLDPTLLNRWGSKQTTELMILPGDLWFSISRFMAFAGLIPCLIYFVYCWLAGKSPVLSWQFWCSVSLTGLGALFFLLFIRSILMSGRCARDLEELRQVLNLDPDVGLFENVCDSASEQALVELARQVKIRELVVKDPSRSVLHELSARRMDECKQEFNRVYAVIEKFRLAHGKGYYYQTALDVIRANPELSQAQRDILQSM